MTHGRGPCATFAPASEDLSIDEEGGRYGPFLSVYGGMPRDLLLFSARGSFLSVYGGMPFMGGWNVFASGHSCPKARHAPSWEGGLPSWMMEPPPPRIPPPRGDRRQGKGAKGEKQEKTWKNDSAPLFMSP